MAEGDDLSEARRRFPRGGHFPGRVRDVPWGAGRTGLFVDLGAPPTGFVDVLFLPQDPSRWPVVGSAGMFEVTQHRRGQVRLFPLDTAIAAPLYGLSTWSAQEWAAIARRYPVGSAVVGTVTEVYSADRQYGVRFDDNYCWVEYDEAPPTVGTASTFVIARHLERTRRLIVQPAPEPTKPDLSKHGGA